MASTTSSSELEHGAIGLRDVLFQSITAMAPGAAIAASIPAGAAFAGGALPLAVIVAMVACLFAASSIGELASHLPAAGGVATYSSRGLHPMVGFLVAWGYVFVEALVPTLLLLQLGFTTASTVHSEWSGYPADLWWPWAVLGAILIATVAFFGAKASAKFGTILGAFEIIVFVILAILFIGKAGSHNTLSVFGTSHTPKAYAGISGVIAGSVYTILAFSGFEAAAPLAEEAKDPRRTIRRAIVGATLAIGVIYIFTTYAADVLVGPDKFASFGTEGANSWEGIARASFGLYWVLVFFAIINSTVANANAGLAVSTRMAFALGRIGVLPTSFARLHPKHRSPVVGIAVQFAIAIIATLVLGFAYNPVTAFVLVATIIVIVVVIVYIVVNAACIGFFLRFERGHFHWLRHGVVPTLGIIAFIPALLTSAGIPVFSFVTPLSAPISYAGPIVAGWMVIGVAYLVYLWTRHRSRVVATGLVHLDAEPDQLAEAVER
ncbi:APC family permease [Allobranchiibius sp. CTAmp26]|uniref:APC family permease n=1 Tax=Allobranchiibius sp. CTAmp26 TaxID=2815214 RepID=UPI001AA151F7|nr:APC family permease [Allobranchiibius sp. CTAmp26]MBO1753546.1 APC family permease [Allobranchiibius sp. CTAmp26]